MTDPVGRDHLHDTLPPQLWVDWHGRDKPPGQHRFDRPRTGLMSGVAGGMWTSTHDGNGGSPYIDRLREITSGHVQPARRRAWVLTPARCRVLEVNDRMGLIDLAIAVPETPVWERAPRWLDAIHVTAQGARAFRHLPDPDHPWTALRHRMLVMEDEHLGRELLDGWDAESTLWLTWQFVEVEVEEVDPVLVPPIDVSQRDALAAARRRVGGA